MKEMRYRKPSIKTLVGITKFKKRVKKALGITAIMRPFRALPNYKRRLLRRAGYYSPEMKMVRAAQRGQMPGPIGPIQVGAPDEAGHAPKGGKLLMAAALASGLNKEQGHKGHEGHAPHLAEALVLATALKGDHKAHASQDEQATEEREAEGEPEPEAHPHKHERRKRHAGARVFRLLLVALLTALAIMLVWFFFLA